MDAKSKKITIIDIAKEAGVSPSLVSRVISGKGSVSREKRIQIKEIIERYNYRPNAIARSLQKGHTKTIGFIIPTVGNEYFASMFYNFEKEASENNYLTILCCGKGEYNIESNVLRALEETRVEGIVFVGGRIDACHLEDRYIQEMKQISHNIPSVICGTRTEVFGCAGTYTDDEIGTQLLFQHLKEQKYKSMALVGGYDSIYPTYIRTIQYAKAASDYGIEFKGEQRIMSSYDFEGGAFCLRQLLKKDKLPDVVCCINDQVAAGVLREALTMGLRIPKDIAITGYDGTDVSRRSEVGITSIAHDFPQIGSTMFHTLDSLIHHKSCNELIKVPPTIIKRKSSLRCNVDC